MTESSGREGLPQQEKQDIKKWDSAYKRVALNTLRKVLPGRIRLVHPESTEESIEDQVLKKGEKLKVWLDAIDRETVNGFGTFESQEHPGVIFPYTRISVENVASAAQNRPVNPETEKLPRKTIVVFTPFSPPPGGGPDDIMNTTYDSVLRALPQTAERGSLHAKNITVIALGLPTSKWGSVSEDWLNNLKKNGFSEYGKLYAEMLRPILGKGNVEFFAGSMGTILASETARELQEFWEQLRLLLNNPTGVHSPSDKTIKLPIVGRIPLSAKGIQVIAGFGIEAGIRMKVPFVDELVRKAMSGANSAREALSVILQEKRIMVYESDQQNALKKAANDTAVRLLMKGTPLDTENFRSHIQQATFDPATTSKGRIDSFIDGKKFFQEGRSLGRLIRFTHWMDPGRWPYKWIGKIEQYEKSVEAQTKAI